MQSFGTRQCVSALVCGAEVRKYGVREYEMRTARARGGPFLLADFLCRRKSNLRPRGAPPPSPPRSFLAERGEFDCAPESVTRSPPHPFTLPQSREGLLHR